MDEGYIKFNCNWTRTELVQTQFVESLNFWRKVMYEKNCIGMYPNGIGYGNISIRTTGNQFLISGTATGGIESLNEKHFSLVTAYDIPSNSITCEGPVKASSESLTHALIYECSSSANAVIHIHNLEFWQKWMNQFPTSKSNVAYGTTEMANEIKRLFSETDVSQNKIIIMGGHEEGIISFGKDLQEAAKVLLEIL